MNMLRYHKRKEIYQYINGLIYTYINIAYNQQADCSKETADKQTK